METPRITLIPIKERLEDNVEFLKYPDCMEGLELSVLYYIRVGYQRPWIGYFVKMNNQFVGSAGFKGRPIDGKVEIAYSTFPAFQNNGIGSEMCQKLVSLAHATDPIVRVMARTLMEESYSTRILRKNNFVCNGVVVDTDDGEVWEWEYIKR